MRYSIIPGEKTKFNIIGFDINNIESIDNMLTEIANIARSIDENDETILDLSQIKDNYFRQNIIELKNACD
jgi:septum formation inhibitor MinC